MCTLRDVCSFHRPPRRAVTGSQCTHHIPLTPGPYVPDVPSSLRPLLGFALVAVAACGLFSTGGEPARIVVGQSDTLVVHSLRPTPIAAAVVDEKGREVSGSAVNFQRSVSDAASVSDSGLVTCAKRADVRIVATAGTLSAPVVIRCRPVRSVRMAGPVQFLLGDSAQALPAEVIGTDGKLLDVIAGTVEIGDRSVVGAQAMRLIPRSVGATLVTLRVGDESATAGVHVYEPLDALVHLRPEQRFVAVQLSLRSGEYRRWDLPRGTWMLTMLPYRDEGRGLRLRVEGANCVPEPLTPRRISCFTESGARVTVAHPSKTRAPELAGQLLVRRI